jgi:hypothetical protein
MNEPAVRLYGILARKADSAVIFRRGPSRKVLLVRWNVADDTFRAGQWLSGRIYERRCDLSPNGELLVYFAANYHQPHRSWTAISRPPFLTALAFWPKGDGWGGGGHFQSNNQIALNHRDGEMKLAEGFSLPKGFKLKQFGKRPGWGEDEPIWTARLERDGWRRVNNPKVEKEEFRAKVWMVFSKPLAWRKLNPVWPKHSSLQMFIHGIKEKDGPWYITEHSVTSTGATTNLGRSDWADWSHSGDLLFSKDGCLYRLRGKKGAFGPVEDAAKIADFTDYRFQNCKAPEEMQRWP